MSPEPRGRSAGERQRAAAENGRARSAAWVEAVGALPVTLGDADGYLGEGLRTNGAAGADALTERTGAPDRRSV